MNEELKLLTEKGYFVDKEGNAFSPFTKQRIGYFSKTLPYELIGYKSGNAKVNILIHRLQAYQKYGEALFEPGIVVRHLNGNPLDNSWDNIVIGTVQDNMLDIPQEERVEHALKAARVKRKLNWEDMEQLRKDRENGDTLKVLSSRYKIAKSTVSYIVNNKTYNIE